MLFTVSISSLPFTELSLFILHIPVQKSLPQGSSPDLPVRWEPSLAQHHISLSFPSQHLSLAFLLHLAAPCLSSPPWVEAPQGQGGQPTPGTAVGTEWALSGYLLSGDGVMALAWNFSVAQKHICHWTSLYLHFLHPLYLHFLHPLVAELCRTLLDWNR